jgi:hypothetical protein
MKYPSKNMKSYIITIPNSVITSKGRGDVSEIGIVYLYIHVLYTFTRKYGSKFIYILLEVIYIK